MDDENNRTSAAVPETEAVSLDLQGLEPSSPRFKAVITALGYTALRSLQEHRVAHFTVDRLSKVHLLAPAEVKVLRTPRVVLEDLDGLSAQDAVNILVSEGDNDEQLMKYLQGRKARNGGTDADLGV